MPITVVRKPEVKVNLTPKNTAETLRMNEASQVVTGNIYRAITGSQESMDEPASYHRVFTLTKKEMLNP